VTLHLEFLRFPTASSFLHSYPSPLHALPLSRDIWLLLWHVVNMLHGEGNMLHTPHFRGEESWRLERGPLASPFSLFYHDARLIMLTNFPNVAGDIIALIILQI
jgi:hypothetical protein